MDLVDQLRADPQARGGRGLLAGTDVDARTHLADQRARAVVGLVE
jgi:hypothetical protein